MKTLSKEMVVSSVGLVILTFTLLLFGITEVLSADTLIVMPLLPPQLSKAVLDITFTLLGISNIVRLVQP